MKQKKNTINKGDAMKDAFTRLLSRKVKLTSDALWLGSVESDRTEQGFDLQLSPQGFKSVFGKSGGFGSPRVRLHFGWSSMAFIKGGSDFQARIDHSSQSFDFLVHIRETQDGRIMGLVVPQAQASEFLKKFAREKHSAKNGWFIQLDGYELSIKGKPAQKWQDFVANCNGWIVDLTDIGFIMDDTLSAVNAKGRIESQMDTSNPINAKRKVGVPYNER